MKNILIILIFSIIYSSCSPSSDNDTELIQNTPSAPILIFPAQNELCLTNALEFKWNPSINSDGSSSPVIYVFEIAKDNQFSNIVESKILTSTSKISILEKGVAYFWRVKAKSVSNIESSYSTTYKFYTEEVAISNHLPFAPAIVNPIMGQNLNYTSNLNLEWSASDIDQDPLKYDVYFGTDKNALVLVAENFEHTTLQVNISNSNTMYYWKVIVKDTKEAQVTGPLWNFKIND